MKRVTWEKRSIFLINSDRADPLKQTKYFKSHPLIFYLFRKLYIYIY